MPHQCTNCGHAFADGSKEMLSGCPECGGNTFQFHPGDVPEEPPSDAEPPDDDAGVSGAVGRAANTVRDLVSRDSSGGPSPSPDAPPPDAPSPDAPSPGASTPASGADVEAASGDDAEAASDPGAATPPETSTDPETATSAATDTDADTGSTGSLGALTDREWPAVSRPDDTETGTDAPGDDILDAEAEDLAPADADTTPENTGEDRAQADARGSFASLGPASSDDSVDGEESAAGADGADDIRVAEEDPDSVGEHSPDGDDDQPDLAALRQELNEQFESIRIVEPGQYELNLMELYNREEYIIALQENGRYVIEVPDTWRD